MDGGGDRTTALAELVEDAPCGIVVTDSDARLLYINQTLTRWLQLPPAEHGRPRRLPDLLTLPGRLYHETHLAPMMRIQGFVREISCAMVLPDGGSLPVLLSGVARHDETGRPVRFDYTIFDARERRIYENELVVARRQADELAAIVRTSPNAILRVEPDGIISSWNAGAERLLKIPASAALGRPVQAVVNFPRRPGWFAEAVETCVGTDEAVSEMQDERGQHFETTVVAIAEKDAASPCSYSVILRDISERKRSEERLKVSMAEMKHRVKNTFAVVSGIARQTLPAESREPFIGRLHALMRANDVLTDEVQKTADLRELLALTAEEAGGPERFRVTAPTFMLPANKATSLSMALHELATNALKYGALSTPHGYVRIDCTPPDRPNAPLRLIWQEHDGPTVVPPTREGFGSRMIRTVLQADLEAEVEFAYRPEGVRFEITFSCET